MSNKRVLTTREKALDLNLKSHIYGSFAEIGAGQEVANHFFKAGAASGSVAKTMSAYDMAVSDAAYGKTKRYVSEERLRKMLEIEFAQLTQTLPHRVEESNFFALANTIEMLNFKRTNQGQGWMGVRFQSQPGGPVNECVLHMMLHDPTPHMQQEVVGTIGVNLLYACFHYTDPERFIHALVENIEAGRVEVNMLSFSGPHFAHIDNRLVSLLLVKNDISRVAMFGPDGRVLQPAVELYKKDLLILRGRFRPPTKVNIDMFANAYDQFRQEPEVADENIVQIAELTLFNLRDQGSIDPQDFLDRADLLCSLGYSVLISNFREHHQLAHFVNRFIRHRKVRIIIGVQNLQEIFQDHYYKDLGGGILESFGSLFAEGMKLYVYPSMQVEGVIKHCSNVKVSDQARHLFDHLLDNGRICGIEQFDQQVLHIKSDKVLRMIRAGNGGWEEMVPEEVKSAIQAKGLFRQEASAEQA